MLPKLIRGYANKESSMGNMLAYLGVRLRRPSAEQENSLPDDDCWRRALALVAWAAFPQFSIGFKMIEVCFDFTLT